MSVALMITSRETGSDRILPIATEALFRATWKPLARSLGLCWIPQFETGISLERSDLVDVVAELDRVLQACDASRDLHDLIFDRADRLARELRRICESNEDVDIFVG